MKIDFGAIAKLTHFLYKLFYTNGCSTINRKSDNTLNVWSSSSFE